MMIKTSAGYLDFNGDIEMERRSKLFEDLESNVGDFSYTFDLVKTHHNLELLGLPFPDNAGKIIYQNIEADLISDTGEILYSGFLRVDEVDDVIACSFFSGNTNWIAAITGNLSDLDFSEYNTELTFAGIEAAMVNTEGVTIPLMDCGSLITRSTRNLKAEDFNGCMYVKTIFKKIFQYAGLKLKGEILNDFVFNNSIVCKNNKNQEEIDSGSAYVQKTSTTARPSELTRYKLTFDNDSVYPFFNGSGGYWSLVNNKFTAPFKMRVHIVCTMEPSIKDSSYSQRIYLYINGTFPGFVDIGDPDGGLYNEGYVGEEDTHTLDRRILLEAGDELEFYTEWQQSTGSTQNDIIAGTLKITPEFLYQVSGSACVPAWSNIDFVKNYLALFNTITDYNPYTKEVTVNFFKNLSSKTPKEISPYIEKISTNFSELVSNFGQSNLLTYQESDAEEVRDYNVNKFIKYAAGVIEIDNDYIQKSVTLIDSEFKAPISYVNDVFECSMERISILELQTTQGTSITSVTDNLGTARLNVANNYYLVGDLVRIENAQDANYNGDYIVGVVGSGYIECYNLPYFTDSTADISRLDYKYGNSDDVFLMLNIPDYASDQFGSTFIDLEDTWMTNFAYPFFNLLDVGKQVNQDYKDGLSFGSVVSNLFYQRTLIEQYWSNVGPILNDPVKLLATAFLPEKVFKELSPLYPVYLKTKETTNLYYINLITGYKSAHQPCEIELIKLLGAVSTAGDEPSGGASILVDNVLLEGGDNVLTESSDYILIE